MNLDINSNQLFKALKTCYPAIKSNSTLDIYKTFKIEAKEGFLTITANNGGLEIVSKTECPSMVDGAACVDAAILYGTVSELKDQTINISKKEKTLKFSYESGEFELGLSNVNEFPVMSCDDEITSFEMDYADFDSISTLVAPFVPNDMLRSAFTGVNFSNNGKLNICATDATILSKLTLDPVDANFDVIIPSDFFKLSKVLESNISLNFTIHKKNCVIKQGNIIIKSTLIDSKFPNYNAVIPDNDKSFTFNLKDFISQFKIVRNFINVQMPAIYVDVKNGYLSIRTSREETNNSSTAQMSCTHEFDDVTFCFTPELLSRFISDVNEQEITFEYKSHKQPLLIKNENLLRLIVPRQ